MTSERPFGNSRRGVGRRQDFRPTRPIRPDGFDPPGPPPQAGPDFEPPEDFRRPDNPALRGRGRRTPPWSPGRGRAGRGDVRAAILLLLFEQPMHGYQIIHELADRTGGIWHPSPGAVYPAMSLLEDEGLITITSQSGRKLATLTEAGQSYVENEGDQLWAPWQSDRFRTAASNRALAEEIRALTQAVHQAMRTGGDSYAERAIEIMATARRAIYAMLAEPPAEVTQP